MYGRYELCVDDSNSCSIFRGYFISINKLAKTLSCFNNDNLVFTVTDVVLDRRYSADELRKIFMNEMVIL